jgi:hypothetical protein
MAALWTGCLVGGQPATSLSIDQAVAAQLNSGRPFNTVSLYVRSPDDFPDREVKTRMIYGSAAAGGTVGFVDPIDDPSVARSTLFPSSASTSSSGPDKKTFIRGKVFNQLNSDLTAIQSRLCNEDKNQLQSIQAAWNDLNTQLAAAATAAASCMPPEAIPSGYTSPSPNFPQSAQLQMDIMALALACDLTRIGSIQFSTSTSQVKHTWAPNTASMPQVKIHHDYSHEGPSSLYSLGTDLYNTAGYQAALSSFPDYTGPLANIDLWYAQQVAYFAQKLAGLTTISGKNLLAQTVICWGNELDLGTPHNHDDTPFVLIGGGGGKLKTGQLVQFPLALSNALNNGPSPNGRYHNDLLTTLAQVMGATSITNFGTPSGVGAGAQGKTLTFTNGPIKEIMM